MFYKKISLLIGIETEKTVAVVLTLVMIAVVIPAHAQTEIEQDEWIITGHVEVSNKTIILKGNLTVKSHGSLILSNVSLDIEGAGRGIKIEGNGRLEIHDSDVFSEHHYTFEVNGQMSIHDSKISRMRNIKIKSDDVLISNSTITDAESYGIFCYHSNPVIVNSTIKSNAEKGIYCFGASPRLEGNVITENGGKGSFDAGVHVAYQSSPLIINNNISSNSMYGISISDASIPTVRDNEINNNKFGILVVDSSPSISNNTISDNWNGIYLLRSTNTLSEIALSSNRIGIYAYASISTVINSHISSSEFDFYLDGDSTLTVTNTTFDHGKVYFEDDGSRLILPDEVMRKEREESWQFIPIEYYTIILLILLLIVLVAIIWKRKTLNR